MVEKKNLCLPLLLLLFEVALGLGSLEDDLGALMAFKGALDPVGSLTSWNQADASACFTWRGVTCAGGRVTRLVLEGLSLSGGGGLASLSRLDQLRVLSLKSNHISGPIPDLSHLSALKLLFLSNNALSGPIPASISALSRLYRLDLSRNNLSGPVPVELNRLSRLLTLRLDSNRLSGSISDLDLPHLQDLNLSSNLLSGAIPSAFAGFPEASFAANSGLCGRPFLPCDPSRAMGTTNSTANASAVVASNPSSKPEVASPSRRVDSNGGGRMSRAAVVAIVAGDFAVLVLVSGLLFCYFWKKFAGRKYPSRLQEGEKIVYSSSPYGVAGASGFERGRMVFLDDGGGARRFELEDLLRASAEMLGKGGYGTAYKAVLDDGSVVAVKRLRDVFVTGKREFEHHVETLGRLRHPNIVPLTAYYYAREEKLLVYDFMPNGSLFSLLHGNRGPGRTPLDWTARLRIAAGAARGLAHIHHARKLAHGNVKSTNVLLDKSGNARLADYGLALLGPSPPAAARSAGYRPPEAPADARRPWATQRGDVYSFGVVLLELLTGKPASDGASGGSGGELPRWVASVVREEWTAEVFDLELMRYKGIEEEMVAMLQIAMGCTAASPDQRPKIAHVVKMIDEIRAGGTGEMSPSHESFDSVSDSPSVSEDAGAASQ
ncbi:probable leucine-rich repeat receptor-like protein kinase At1g68400 [Typha latifolia]|uniref:probable leucine-rich repeat receptor-like protein kinase At1g68400 n=1 Tax=Typha latifolia TaxID=4733 RepID=UPI003C2D0E72